MEEVLVLNNIIYIAKIIYVCSIIAFAMSIIFILRNGTKDAIDHLNEDGNEDLKDQVLQKCEDAKFPFGEMFLLVFLAICPVLNTILALSMLINIEGHIQKTNEMIFENPENDKENTDEKEVVFNMSNRDLRKMRKFARKKIKEIESELHRRGYSEKEIEEFRQEGRERAKVRWDEFIKNPNEETDDSEEN